jgi:hypothetical protein
VQFVSIAQRVNEATGRAVFEVELSEPPQTQVTVRYATTDQGTARAGVDYVAATGILTFTAGTTQTQQFEIDIIDNNNPGSTSLIIELQDPQGDARLSPSRSIATLVILDNEITPLSSRTTPNVVPIGLPNKPLHLVLPAQQPPSATSRLLLPAPGGG